MSSADLVLSIITKSKINSGKLLMKKNSKTVVIRIFCQDENDLNSDFSDEDWEETDVELTEDDLIMDEEHIETIERLKEIGIHDDYFEYVNVEFLAEISDLPFLTQVQRDWFAEDIMNINYGMSFFQPETNRLIRWLVQKIN